MIVHVVRNENISDLILNHKHLMNSDAIQKQFEYLCPVGAIKNIEKRIDNRSGVFYILRYADSHGCRISMWKF